jgi:hypothetical protein
MSVGKLNIGKFIILFIVYISLHSLIGYFLNKTKKEVTENPGNIETEKTLKILTIIFKWFPAIMLVIILIILYLG